MHITPYTPSMADTWNNLVMNARNATFLFHRDFMDYHAGRFHDASLLFYRGDKLLGALPATAQDDTITSHGGLTYGGLLLHNGAHATDVGEMMQQTITHYRKNGYKHLTIKPVPAIYHSQPADDILYWLFRHGAHLDACALSTAISLDTPLPFSTLRRRKVKRAEQECVTVLTTHEDADYATFWKILAQVLREKHDKRPVHTLREILLLRDRFPRNILLVIARHPATDEILAGTLLFVTPQVIHAQYIAASPRGRETGALDLIFHHLVQHYTSTASHRYLDFGVSTEDGGRWLNEGLIFQKEGFGGRSIVYDTYTLDL